MYTIVPKNKLGGHEQWAIGFLDCVQILVEYLDQLSFLVICPSEE